MAFPLLQGRVGATVAASAAAGGDAFLSAHGVREPGRYFSQLRLPASSDPASSTAMDLIDRGVFGVSFVGVRRQQLVSTQQPLEPLLVDYAYNCFDR